MKLGLLPRGRTSLSLCPRGYFAALVWLAVDRRRVKLRQLEASVPVWSLQDGDLRPSALEPYDAVHPITIDRRLAPRRESERGEERRLACEVLDDDADVFHPLARHVLDEGTRLSSSVNCPLGTDRAARARHHAAPLLPALEQDLFQPVRRAAVRRCRTPSRRAAAAPLSHAFEPGAAPRRRERRVP